MEKKLLSKESFNNFPRVTVFAKKSELSMSDQLDSVTGHIPDYERKPASQFIEFKQILKLKLLPIMNL